MPYQHRVTVETALFNINENIVADKDINGRALVEIRHTKEKLEKDYIFMLSTDYTATYKNGSVNVSSITISGAKFKYADERNRDNINYTFGEDDYRLVANSIKDKLIGFLQSRNMDVSTDKVDATKYRIRVDTSDSERRHVGNRHLGAQFSVSNATAHGYLPICVTDTMKLIARFSTRLDITKENAVFVNGVEIKRKVAKVNNIGFDIFEVDQLFWADESKRETDAAPTYSLTEEDLEQIKTVIADNITARYYQLQFPLGRDALTA